MADHLWCHPTAEMKGYDSINNATHGKGRYVMQWHEVQRLFPKQWVLLEEIRSHAEGGKLVIDDMAVIRSIPNADVKQEFFAATNERFVFHTSKDTVAIPIQDAPSIRRRIP